MRHSGAVIALLCMLMAATGSLATDYGKLSGYVGEVAKRHSAYSGRLLRQRTPVRSETMLTAFLQVADGRTAEVCRNYGLRHYAQIGDVSIVGIPLNAIGPLSEHQAVRRIEASPSARLTLDTTAIVVGADKVQQGTLQTAGQAFTGKGVVVGLMDVGFDLTHPNFYDAAMERYRIGAFWDQLSRDTVGSPFPVGRDYRGADSVRAHQASVDGQIQYHGTHTLGIAAGSGYGTGYRGIAYDAELCLVSNAVNSDIELIDSADIEKYTSAVDALGFKYIFDYADSLGLPCVASLSEGYSAYLDEDDVLYAYTLYNLIGPGRIIVASAGNESLKNTYLKKKAGQEEAGAFISASKDVALYRVKTKSPLHVTLYSYSGDSPHDTLHFDSQRLATDTLIVDTLFTAGDTLAVSMERHPSTFGSDTIYLVTMMANTELYNLPPMAIVINGEDCEAELFGNSSCALTKKDIDPRWNGAENGHNVLAPGCFPSVICVGATIHRMGYFNHADSLVVDFPDEEVGVRGRYSSYGPAISGFDKPDVMAPGHNLISSNSSFYLDAHQKAVNRTANVAFYDYNGRTYSWMAASGTSMAAPVVAGTIALWLQANPQLTTAEIRDIMSRTCRHPVDTLDYPNAEYGHGEIDAYRGLLDVLGVDGMDCISGYQPRQLRMTAGEGWLHLHSDRGLLPPLRLRVYTLNGTLLTTIAISEGQTTVAWPETAAVSHGQVVVIQIDSSDATLKGSQLVRL